MLDPRLVRAGIPAAQVDAPANFPVILLGAAPKPRPKNMSGKFASWDGWKQTSASTHVWLCVLEKVVRSG